jgi:hypothetical protein
MNTTTVLTVIMLFFSVTLMAQDMPFTPSAEQQKITNNTKLQNTASLTQESEPYVPSQREIDLATEINNLKKTDNPANIQRIQELTNEINAISKQSVTSPMTPYDGKLEFAQNSPVLLDNIMTNATRVLLHNDVKCMATFTEQRGTNVGKIWTVVGIHSNNPAAPDSARIFYSTNNGTSWTLYANMYLGGTDRFNTDEMDMEIMESTTGQKYIWIVYGLTATNGTGKKFVGGAVISTPTFGGSLFAYSWPGNDAAKKYYFPRITSDNASYLFSPYTYIAISFDSANVVSQKLAVCTSPYTVSPTITYKADRVYWVNGSTYPKTLHTDIAYFKSGGNDSLMFVFSNVNDSTKLFFSKTGISAPYVGTSGGSSVGGSSPTARKSYARLSTNGIDNGSMICLFNEYDGSNRRAKYFRSTTSSFAGTFNQSTYFGSTTAITYAPEIVGVRGSNSHNLAMIHWGTSADSLQLLRISSSGSFLDNNLHMNHNVILTSIISPKPGVRFVTNDSCFVLFNESGPINVWAAYGCSGATVNIGGNDPIPSKFDLAQNYPNPFNPSTVIKFSIPVTGMVKLAIYDITGREVSTLVNEVKQAGNFLVEFNASNLSSGVYFYKLTSGDFTSIKKMMLVK